VISFEKFITYSDPLRQNHSRALDETGTKWTAGNVVRNILTIAFLKKKKIYIFLSRSVTETSKKNSFINIFGHLKRQIVAGLAVDGCHGEDATRVIPK